MFWEVLLAALPSATCQGSRGCSCPHRCLCAAHAHSPSPRCLRTKGRRWMQASLEVFVLERHGDRNYFIKGLKLCFLRPESSVK